VFEAPSPKILDIIKEHFSNVIPPFPDPTEIDFALSFWIGLNKILFIKSLW
jgi:hypothetical protein